MLAIWSLPFLNPACTSGSSQFTYCWSLPSLKDFEHNLARMWNEHNCMVVWIFFGIALLWEWNESWPFPVSWPLLSFPKWKKVLLSHVQLFVTTCTVPTRLLCPWDSPVKNTGVGCHFLLQGSNPGLPHCGQILFCLSHCMLLSHFSRVQLCATP